MSFLGKRFLEDCEVDFDGKGYLWNITGHIVLCITFIGMETCLHVEWDG